MKKKQSEFETFTNAPTILGRDAQCVEGLLRSVEQYGGGLLQIRLGSRDWLVSDELERKLKPLIGKKVLVIRVEDDWGCGKVPA